MAKAGRGVLYIVWGDRPRDVLNRSIASVKRLHPELPIEIARIEGVSGDAGLLISKTEMFERSPFAETLYLDADTVVLDRLDFGFDKAVKFGLACSICEAPWARRHRGLATSGDLIEYNTGVVFFSEKSIAVFDLWRRLATQLDSALIYAQSGKAMVFPFNDQASFASAIDQCGISPFVLPLNWNFRAEFQKSFFGPIKVWHSYMEVPAEVLRLNTYYREPLAIIQYAELR